MTDSGTSDTGGSDVGSGDAGGDDAGGDDAGDDDAGSDDAGADASTGTPCGETMCDPATEVCFECACGGPMSFSCTPVPSACSEDRSCTCIGPELCTTGLMECTDRGDNHVFCDTGLD